MYYVHKDPEWLESHSETKAQIQADCVARDTSQIAGGSSELARFQFGFHWEGLLQ